MKFLNVFYFCGSFLTFALLDPDCEYGSGSGPTDLIESGSNTEPDPKPCFNSYHIFYFRSCTRRRRERRPLKRRRRRLTVTPTAAATVTRTAATWTCAASSSTSWRTRSALSSSSCRLSSCGRCVTIRTFKAFKGVVSRDEYLLWRS